MWVHKKKNHTASCMGWDLIFPIPPSCVCCHGDQHPTSTCAVSIQLMVIITVFNSLWSSRTMKNKENTFCLPFFSHFWHFSFVTQLLDALFISFHSFFSLHFSLCISLALSLSSDSFLSSVKSPDEPFWRHKVLLLCFQLLAFQFYSFL